MYNFLFVSFSLHPCSCSCFFSCSFFSSGLCVPFTVRVTLLIFVICINFSIVATVFNWSQCSMSSGCLCQASLVMLVLIENFISIMFSSLSLCISPHGIDHNILMRIHFLRIILDHRLHLILQFFFYGYLNVQVCLHLVQIIINFGGLAS